MMNFSKIYSDPKWNNLVSVMKEKLKEKELREEKLNVDWLKSISNNRVKNKNRSAKCRICFIYKQCRFYQSSLFGFNS